MTLPSRRVPMPEDLAVRRVRPADHFVRAAVCHLRNGVTRQPVLDELDARYGEDKPTEIILKAASNPATLTSAGWATDVAAYAMADFVVGLAPMSAGAALIARGMQLRFDGYAVIIAPTYVTSATDAGGFVTEGAPIPTRIMSISEAPAFTPHKFAAISYYNRELAKGSDFENIVKQILSEAVALAIDAQMFSSVAADATKPPGLLSNVTALSAKSGGGQAAAIEDVKTLVDALTVARNVVFVASPATAKALKGWLPFLKDDVLESSVIAKNTLIAIEASAFASGFSPVPEFHVTDQTIIHENTVALPIVDGSSTVAAPSRSLWQTASLALRTILRCTWGMRASGMIQQITGVSW